MHSGIAETPLLPTERYAQDLDVAVLTRPGRKSQPRRKRMEQFQRIGAKGSLCRALSA